MITDYLKAGFPVILLQTQDQHRADERLRKMPDHAVASMPDVPLLRLDMGQRKNSLVCESERRSREAATSMDAFGNRILNQVSGEEISREVMLLSCVSWEGKDVIRHVPVYRHGGSFIH